MATRTPLRKHLTAAWNDVVSGDYANQRINSERSLQASLWSQLNTRLPTQFRMFIEPRFTLSNDTRVFPDIVICNSRSVICVIEIKYRPRTQAAHRKDVRTLNALALNSHSLSLSNRRFFGPAVDDREYKFATHTLFVWAGFHRAPQNSSYKDLPPIATDYPRLADHFMQLHAETDHLEHPAVFSRLS